MSAYPKITAILPLVPVTLYPNFMRVAGFPMAWPKRESIVLPTPFCIYPYMVGRWLGRAVKGGLGWYSLHKAGLGYPFPITLHPIPFAVWPSGPMPAFKNCIFFRQRPIANLVHVKPVVYPNPFTFHPNMPFRRPRRLKVSWLWYPLWHANMLHCFPVTRLPKNTPVWPTLPPAAFPNMVSFGYRPVARLVNILPVPFNPLPVYPNIVV